jgi:hypothetical protein
MRDRHRLKGVAGSCSPPVRHIREVLTRILAAVLHLQVAWDHMDVWVQGLSMCAG